MRALPLALSLSLLLLSACGNPAETHTETAGTTVSATTNRPATPSVPREQCFLEARNRDTTLAPLAFDDNRISGRLYWNPFEKDGALGSLSGSQQGDTLVATYDYTIEGSQQQEEKIMLLRKDSLLVFSGELDNRGGKLTIKDRSRMTIGQRLHSVDCKQVQIPQ